MKVVKGSLLLAVGLLTLAAGTAFAQQTLHNVGVNAQRVGPTAPKVVSKSHQPVGTPHKASSFAPHPTSRRVFGDPIQAPIVHSAPPPKKSTPR